VKSACPPAAATLSKRGSFKKISAPAQLMEKCPGLSQLLREIGSMPGRASKFWRNAFTHRLDGNAELSYRPFGRHGIALSFGQEREDDALIACAQRKVERQALPRDRAKALPKAATASCSRSVLASRTPSRRSVHPRPMWA